MCIRDGPDYVVVSGYAEREAFSPSRMTAEDCVPASRSGRSSIERRSAWLTRNHPADIAADIAPAVRGDGIGLKVRELMQDVGPRQIRRRARSCRSSVEIGSRSHRCGPVLQGSREFTLNLGSRLLRPGVE